MNKFCIFCGRKPEAKSREHVIPDWLIRLTGNPKRIANFGIDWTKSPPRERLFAFDEFTFPACQDCNEGFSRLEANAKPIIEGVLAKRAISAHQFNVFFDWCEKIRVGLWLGFLYLDKNPVGITPKFHIRTRIRQADRAVVMIRIRDRQEGINFIGPNLPCFQSSPTCFALLINDWCVVNVSGVSINSRRLGFPYAQLIHFTEDEQLEVSIKPGTRRIMRPVQRDISYANATILQQPIFPRSLMTPEIEKWFQEEWIRCRSIDSKNGVGSIFIETPDLVSLYPADESRAWIPNKTWSLAEMERRIVPFVFSRMIRDLKYSADLSPKHLRKGRLLKISGFQRINNVMLRLLRNR